MNIKTLIGISADMIENSKLHFAIGPGPNYFEALEIFCRGEFKQWQEDQSRKNFGKDYILSFIYYGKNEWLFAGVYKSHDVELINGRYRYFTEELKIAEELVGRLVIRYEKLFRASYVHTQDYIDKFELVEILRERYTVEPFPGYEKVKINYQLLKSIVSQEEKSWKTALSIVKGVYLISDISIGKLYVGSAYGEFSFWNRWKEYVQNGHGGNLKLKEFIKTQGIEYANNFQFSILETRGMNSEDDEIIRRESFWKEILLSREFGYNKN
ncbi:GIY-YIG nuclease family protein [Ignavibacteriales bacterium]